MLNDKVNGAKLNYRMKMTYRRDYYNAAHRQRGESYFVSVQNNLFSY